MFAFHKKKKTAMLLEKDHVRLVNHLINVTTRSLTVHCAAHQGDQGTITVQVLL